MQTFLIGFIAAGAFQLTIFLVFIFVRWIMRMRSRRQRLVERQDEWVEPLDQLRQDVRALGELFGYEVPPPWDRPDAPRWIAKDPKSKPGIRRRRKFRRVMPG